jgi:hypothetical protein
VIVISIRNGMNKPETSRSKFRQEIIQDLKRDKICCFILFCFLKWYEVYWSKWSKINSLALWSMALVFNTTYSMDKN